jgi:DNA-binding response OmpR family regulator
MIDANAMILIADDDSSCLTTTAAFLARNGYLSDCASTGDEALSLLKQNRYDLLLSDIEMPGNGDLRLIQALPQIQPGLPVILMTGYPTVETAANAVGLSVAAYLIKPLDPECLLAEVSRAIERFRCFRMVSDARQRLAAACKDLEQVESSLGVLSSKEIKAPITAFLDLTMQNVMASLLDLRRLVEAVNSDSGRRDLEWLQSARPLVLVNAIREAIAVLTKTKSAFKSKELADLRHKLESLVQKDS